MSEDIKVLSPKIEATGFVDLAVVAGSMIVVDGLFPKNQMVPAVLKLAAGAVSASVDGKAMRNVGAGIILSGVTDLLGVFMPRMAATENSEAEAGW